MISTVRRLAPALPLLLAACASRDGGDYPSLLPRPIEARSDAEPVPVAATAPAVDPALDRTLAERRADLRRHAASFDVQQARAAQAAAAARGRPAGSDPWLDAQTALAGLDGERADVSALVGDLEARAIERGTAGQPDYAALTTLQRDAAAELDRQTRRIAALQRMLAH